MRPVFLFLLPIVCACAYAQQSTSYIRSDERYLYGGNDRIELVFQKSDGRLYSLVDKISGTDFLARKDAYWGPFNFLMKLDGKDEYISGGQANKFTSEAVPGKDLSTLILTWQQFRTSGTAVLDVQVRVIVDIPAVGGLTSWRIALTNNEDRVMREVTFPNLHGVPQLSRDGKNDYLAYPSMSGMLFQDPLNNFKLNRGHGWELFYPSAMANMQFSAYYSNEKRAGLYLATQDTRGDSKFLSVSKLFADWLSLSVMHRLPIVPRRGFATPYAAVLGVFSGDWYDAAQIYRAWAQDQDWYRNASLQRKDGAPDWFRKLPLHQWIHTNWDCRDQNPYANVLNLSQSTANRMSVPVAADWVGWERFGWYIDYPKVFPPKEGWTSFDLTVARTQEIGNRIWVVPNTTSFSSRVPEWEQAKPAAILDAQGNYPSPFEYAECGQKAAFHQICPATSFWQSELRSLLLELARRKVDIIQFDGFPVVPATACYSTAHGHVPGAPDLYAASYRALFESIKADARRVNPKVQVSAEGMAEFYLGFLDSVWDAFTTGWSPTGLAAAVSDPIRTVQLIPLWHAVYHDAALIQSGLSLIHRQDSATPSAASEHDYYVRGLGRALVWGEAPSFAANRDLAVLNEPAEADLLDYMKRIVQARRGYAASFLTSGRMLRPPETSVPEINLPGAANIPYTGATYPPSTSPAVLGSLWRASNGDVGYVFTNISHAEVAFDLTVSDTETMLSRQGAYEVYLVRNGAYSLAEASVGLPRKMTVRLSPLDVLLVGVAPSSGDAASPRVAPGGIVSASSYSGDAIAPGELFTVFGNGMGPVDLAGLRLAADGRVSSDIAGTRVLFDGLPAPLIYSQDRQVSGIAPYGLAGKASTQVQVEYRGAKSRSVTVPVAPTVPGIFTLDASGRGAGVIWNQNGAINSTSNPAARGDIIAFWATGEGAVSPDAADGQVAGANPPKPKAAVSVRIDGIEAEILYAAAAPQAVAGVFQANVRVPLAARTGASIPIVLTVGDVRSQPGVTIALK